MKMMPGIHPGHGAEIGRFLVPPFFIGEIGAGLYRLRTPGVEMEAWS